MEVEVEGEKVIKELEKSVPRIRDALILLLASKTYSDLGTADGKLRLKEEILQQLAKVPGGKKIRNVFFTEFVAQ
jgi:flagellar FliL protein